MSQLRRTAWGTAVALAGISVCAAVMLPFRAHLSPATTALVLVVPVVAGVVIGGFGAGILAAIAGFVTYDVAFIKPYGTLDVGAGQNWTALGVYAAVVLLISRLVAYLEVERRRARQREADTRRLYRLVERLIAERPLDELLEEVVATVMDGFGPRWAAVVLPRDDHLELVASAGEPISPGEREALQREPHGRLALALTNQRQGGLSSVALHVHGRPIGLLALCDVELDAEQRELLRIYANQAAQAIERSELRDVAVRAEILEESERWRRALLGAVSHDLRSPLATIKAAVTAVRDSGERLPQGERHELLELIDGKTDELSRLVTNLLDFTRIQAGALQLQREPTPVEDIVEAAVAAAGDSLGEVEVVTKLAPGLPPVDVDELLMSQVVANLLENAARHVAPHSVVEIRAARADDVVALAVQDQGTGIAPGERERIFEMWTTSDGGGRAGLGLGIAKAFVEAHGQHIRLEDTPGGGATFVLTMAVAPVAATESSGAHA